ncbi:MAG: hydratase [Pseudomonadota bacterium]
MNIALYGPRKARWAMTEYGEGLVSREASSFAIGNNSLRWNGDQLIVEIDEVSAPLNRHIRGRIIVDSQVRGQDTFFIDDAERHRWRPLSPVARVRVEMDKPNISWSGDGYLDFNQGKEGLEDAFRFWDWSRAIIGREKTAILYNTDMMNGTQCQAALLVDRTGAVADIDVPPPAPLRSTSIWQIPRRTRSDGIGSARIIKTLEDTPFYSRSIVSTRLFGEDHVAIHESLSGPRLNSPLVQVLLPYRMPRKE